MDFTEAKIVPGFAQTTISQIGAGVDGTYTSPWAFIAYAGRIRFEVALLIRGEFASPADMMRETGIDRVDYSLLNVWKADCENSDGFRDLPIDEAETLELQKLLRQIKEKTVNPTDEFGELVWEEYTARIVDFILPRIRHVPTSYAVEGNTYIKSSTLEEKIRPDIPPLSRS